MNKKISYVIGAAVLIITSGHVNPSYLMKKKYNYQQSILQDEFAWRNKFIVVKGDFFQKFIKKRG